jgi:hypothetical protein
MLKSTKHCKHIKYCKIRKMVTETSNSANSISRCNATYLIYVILKTYLYCMTKYTQVLLLAILMTQVREEIARIHPIQAMKQSVQPHLQVQKMLLWQLVGIVCIPCSKTAEIMGLHYEDSHSTYAK